MLTIFVPEGELYDASKNEFIYLKATTLVLEHSLVSISKWESKWKKSYLNTSDKTLEENLDYIRCMTITKNVNPLIYKNLPKDVTNRITEYINDPMTATTFMDDRQSGRQGVVTSEVIYSWMVTLNIPFECQRWHLNRLLTLIKVCSKNATPPKKMSNAEKLARYSEINAMRRKAMNSKG